VRYRNIWYRPLPPRSIEGGTDGALTTEATTAKRHEIATSLRADAAKLNDTAKMLRLAESLCYENETVTAGTVDKMSHDYVTGLQKLQGPTLEAKKGEAKSVQRAFAFLQKNKIIAVPYAPKTQLDALKASTSKLISNNAIDLSLLISDNFALDTITAPMELFASADLLALQHGACAFGQTFEVGSHINIPRLNFSGGGAATDAGILRVCLRRVHASTGQQEQ
jgi:hypothetical protein